MASLVFHETVGVNLVQLPGLCHVVAFNILGMEIVLHDVAVLVAILALVAHLLKIRHHLWIMDLIGYSIVEGSMPSLVARRNHVHSPSMDLNLACIIAMLVVLFNARIIELLRQRIELPSAIELVSSLLSGQTGFVCYTSLVVFGVSVGNNVEISDSAGMYLALLASPLYASGTLIRPVPMMIVEGQVRDNVKVLMRVRFTSLANRFTQLVGLT